MNDTIYFSKNLSVVAVVLIFLAIYTIGRIDSGCDNVKQENNNIREHFETTSK